MKNEIYNEVYNVSQWHTTGSEVCGRAQYNTCEVEGSYLALAHLICAPTSVSIN